MIIFLTNRNAIHILNSEGKWYAFIDNKVEFSDYDRSNLELTVFDYIKVHNLAVEEIVMNQFVYQNRFIIKTVCLISHRLVYGIDSLYGVKQYDTHTSSEVLLFKSSELAFCDQYSQLNFQQ